jgi:hypothetical protein
MGIPTRAQRVCTSIPTTRSTVRKVVQALKSRTRWPPAVSARRAEWSVDCGTLGDAELEEVVVALQRSGVDCSFERDYNTIVHFNLSW